MGAVWMSVTIPKSRPTICSSLPVVLVVVVVGDLVAGDLSAIARQLEAHQASAQRVVVDGEADEEIPEVLGSQRAAVRGTRSPAGASDVLPAELRVAVVRAREHEEP